MLPEPKGTYDTVGEKVSQELVHFEFASAKKGRGYVLTAEGMDTLRLLNERRYVALRRTMALIHLKTYANLQAVVHCHIAQNGLLNPVVEATRAIDAAYLATLMQPTFGTTAEHEAEELLKQVRERSPKKIEDAVRERILTKLIPHYAISVSLFRSMTDRLLSLRLLNSMRLSRKDAEFLRTYSPCVEAPPAREWHHPMTTTLSTGGSYTVFLSEPDFLDQGTNRTFVEALDTAFSALPEQAGYFDLPDVRDFVCDTMLIPEAAFDEGVAALLEKPKPPVTLGLTYDRITSRRKPLVRTGDSAQIYNLIRRA
jgi:hypothetical protein